MKNNFSLIIIFSLFCMVSLSCTTVPLTGRRQFDFIPAETMLSLSYQQYGDFLKSNKLSTDQAQIQMVKRVGQRLQKAVEKYMAENNLSSRISAFKWEFNLVEDKAVNAWCLPGGKVVVYTGIMSVAQNEQELAVVVAHEIAHAIAQHGNERMSQGLLANMGEVALSSALTKKPEETKKLWMTAFSVGSQYGVLLPYSRLQEGEADYMGLIFMAIAGYDPNAAVTFWGRMAALKKGESNMEFLSTHPSDETRIKNIKAKIPEAMKYYQN